MASSSLMMPPPQARQRTRTIPIGPFAGPRWDKLAPAGTHHKYIALVARRKMQWQPQLRIGSVEKKPFKATFTAIRSKLSAVGPVSTSQQAWHCDPRSTAACAALPKSAIFAAVWDTTECCTIACIKIRTSILSVRPRVQIYLRVVCVSWVQSVEACRAVVAGVSRCRK